MTRSLAHATLVAGGVVVAVTVAAVLVWSRFNTDLQRARALSSQD